LEEINALKQENEILKSGSVTVTHSSPNNGNEWVVVSSKSATPFQINTTEVSVADDKSALNTSHSVTTKKKNKKRRKKNAAGGAGGDDHQSNISDMDAMSATKSMLDSPTKSDNWQHKEHELLKQIEHLTKDNNRLTEELKIVQNELKDLF
jgi:hypothetical protein